MSPNKPCTCSGQLQPHAHLEGACDMQVFLDRLGRDIRTIGGLGSEANRGPVIPPTGHALRERFAFLRRPRHVRDAEHPYADELNLGGEGG